MMKYELNRKILIRTPRFSYTDHLSDKWPILKDMIRESSPSFYAVIELMDYKALIQAEAKVQQTVLKYFNRAKFRSTPYGAFAGVGMGHLTENDHSDVQLHETPILHSFPDWETNVDISIDSVRDPGLLFFANSSYYQLEDEIRFLQRQEDKYILSAIDSDTAVLKIVDACSRPIAYNDLIGSLNQVIEESALVAYLGDLIALQLILTNRHRNIIGQDYFDRVGADNCQVDGTYVIAERPHTGCLSNRHFEHLPELVQKLHELLPGDRSQHLKDFRNKFTRKFEQAEVPIMLAIDPDAGAGYADMAQLETEESLAPFLTDSTGEHPIEANEVNVKFINEIASASQSGSIINLDRINITSKPDSSLPNSISAGVTVIDELLYLDYLGGATANSILGRFGHALPDVAAFSRAIAEREEASNPGILFFDIGYTKEHHIDNINRRPMISDLQLNILNYDTSEVPLLLTDLLVGVQGEQVVLRSKSLNARLLPRLATAYNHRRSDLPLFRFLLDIQNQGLHTMLTFRLSQLLPGLNYYPRVQFKNIVVSPAAWHLPKGIVGKSASRSDKLQALATYIHTKVNSKLLKIGSGDQTLLLDVWSAADIELLLDAYEKATSGNFYVEEAALPEQPVAKSENNAPYLPQVIVTLQHDNAIAKGLTATQKAFTAEYPNQWVPPGANWLYFEIYCKPHRASALLEHKIQGYLSDRADELVKWFFIRYNEGGDHIRLRLQLKDPMRAYSHINQLSQLLAPELASGTVSDLKICTYKREIHRYTPELMDAVEHHFYQDSEYVTAMLQSMLSDETRYRLCVDLFFDVADSGILSPSRLESFLKKMTEAHNKEHGIQSTRFKELNRRFKSFQAVAAPTLCDGAAKLNQKLRESFITLLADCPELLQPKLLADLLHMHVNRLFEYNQRVHEMIIYNFIAIERTRKQHLIKRGQILA